MSRECPHAEARGDAAGGECYRCGETGHIARMCPVSGGSGAPRNPRACYNCGGVGHLSRDCSSAPGAAATASMECYNCGNMGHLSRECPAPLSVHATLAARVITWLLSARKPQSNRNNLTPTGLQMLNGWDLHECAYDYV